MHSYSGWASFFILASNAPANGMVRNHMTFTGLRDNRY